MIDINREAKKSLEKTGFTIVFHHPKENTTLPCVSFYNLSEKPEFSMDNTEAIQKGYIQLDIWAVKASDCGSMAVKINEVLNLDGWSRSMSMDVPEESDIYHKTMRFSKQFILYKEEILWQ